MIDVMVIGAGGRMGSLVCATVEAQPDMRLVAMVDPCLAGSARAGAPCFASVPEALTLVSPKVAVEFTTPATVFENCGITLAAGIHTVVGATGLSAERLETLTAAAAAAGANLFVAPNFALGAVLLMKFAAEAARHYESAEIIEMHHDEKVDSPSGTALRTAQLMAAEGSTLVARADEGQPARGQSVAGIPVHSVRLRGLVAHQEVLFGSTGETLTIRHDSLTRESFMPGVMLAIRNAPALDGTVIGLEHLLV